MAQKPKNVVRRMEKNRERFYPAADVQELSQLIAARNPGTPSDFTSPLRTAIKEGKIVQTRNVRGELGYASAKAVKNSTFVKRVERRPRPLRLAVA